MTCLRNRKGSKDQYGQIHLCGWEGSLSGSTGHIENSGSLSLLGVDYYCENHVGVIVLRVESRPLTKEHFYILWYRKFLSLLPFTVRVAMEKRIPRLELRWDSNWKMAPDGLYGYNVSILVKESGRLPICS